MSPETRRNRVCLAAAAALLLLPAIGCRQNMHNQNKIKPYRESTFYPDGLSARPIPAGTVARGGLGEKIAPYTGLTVSRVAVPPGPPPITIELLRRGQERFNVYCSPCHDRTGSGQGMIVQRGYKQPTSYHTDRLRSMPIDYFVQVMTEGFGVMPSYASQIPLEDRWAIAAYVRALQYSQNARLADLPADRQQALQQELAAPAPSAAPGQPVHPGAPTIPGEHDVHPTRSEQP